jgi:DNA-binding MurR/RpiR family transcriptional regulator
MQHNLLKKIEIGMNSFSKGQKAIAAYILKHYEKAAYMTAAALGDAVGVSESTVVRFAFELDFDGYPELQRSLREAVKIKLTTVQRVELTNSIIGQGDLLSTVLSADSEKIRRTLSEIDSTVFERAVDRIIAAKHIYIIGVRSSAFLAGFLNYNFRMIFDNVRFIQTTSGSEMFEQIINIEKGDVMIAISFPRYSKRIINAVEFAGQRGAGVIALTDGVGSPIAPYADELLPAHSDMVSFVDSLVAPLSIINAIIVAVVRKKQEEFSEKLRELEDIWDKYDVYDKN